MRRAALLASLLLVPAFFAGCVDCGQSGPPVTARDIGPDTDATGGLTGFGLTVRVTDEPNGAPLPGAGVVVYWARDRPADWQGEGQVRLEGRDDGSIVVIGDPSVLHATPEAKNTMRLRTDNNGEVQAKVPSNRIIGVVVAMDGFTEEWLPAVATGGATARDTITVPLFRANMTATFNDMWGPGAASTGFATSNNYAWKPTPFPFSDDDETRRAYLARVSEVRLRLAWTNGENGGGDLGIGIGTAADEAIFIHDTDNDIAPGDRVEEVVLDAAELRRLGVNGGPDGFVGPATDSGFVGPFGLPYAITIESRFDTAAAKEARCLNDVQDNDSGLPGASVPGPAAALVVAALVATAVVMRRRVA